MGEDLARTSLEFEAGAHESKERDRLRELNTVTVSTLPGKVRIIASHVGAEKFPLTIGLSSTSDCSGGLCITVGRVCESGRLPIFQKNLVPTGTSTDHARLAQVPPESRGSRCHVLEIRCAVGACVCHDALQTRPHFLSLAPSFHGRLSWKFPFREGLITCPKRTRGHEIK